MSSVMQHQVSDSNPAASVGVQSWSRGDIFPAIISVVEEYAAPMSLEGWQAAVSQLAQHEQKHRFYRAYLGAFFDRSLDERIISRQYVLSLAGWNDAPFASYDEAHAEALARLAYVDEQDQDSADRLARRSYFSYSPEQVAQGEMAGGSPVANRIGLIRR